MSDDELRLIYDQAARNRFAKFMEDENMPLPEEVNAICQGFALRAVFEAGARAQWIPVSERLPDGNGRVLAAWNKQDPAADVGGMETMTAAGVRALMRSAIDEDDDCFITHWMPLPAAPLAGKGEG